ncbi:hypothetical protein PQ462_06805 [Flavobacterium sp. KACC 22758]|uniref:hypothetical protein n=1 Tax=Flavobacterium sp. KACC 22758 TaxID=3025667 RepID=UPI002366463E|nr:hypothetical protein [Flavobacterium sp. KACC 22758]WDF61071.1 hypothetical protein PQ462_06805 [Flavobacterium sp. KACC 22758]
MKKILTLFAVVGLIAFTSCEGPEGPPGPPGDNSLSPEAFEIKNVNLGRVADNEYNLKSTFQFEVGGNLYDDETVLIYRLTGVINSNTPVWQLLPRTIYLSDGNELDYDYDFSKIDFIITARGTYNLLSKPEYIQNQTFRVVIIPSNLAKTINTNNFSEVMSAANLKESQIQDIKL